MAKSPGGKSVGRVSIRAIPDTSRFREDLRKALNRIERTMEVKIPAVLDTSDLRETATRAKRTIQTQMRANPVELPAEMTLDQAWIARMRRRVQESVKRIDATLPVTVEAEELRRKLQERVDEARKQINTAGLVTMSEEDKVRWRHDVDNLVDDVESATANLEVNAMTAGASAQMRFLARDRLVTIIPQVSKAAAAKVATTIAALSGARVAFSWLDDIATFVGELDKKLPSIALATSGITSLVGVLLSSVSGLVGIGAGLAAIAPAFMVIPGLIIGAGFSIATLVVALKDAREQLAPLADDMGELASIIRTGFWDEAREPIVDLVKNLMPQLRESFQYISESMGGFTADMAAAFGRELADGRLLELMKGISESFDILSEGANGFAGALVSLSAIAAQYAPRLARWFVTIADRFDAWLKQTAEDGRMTEWIDNAIKAIKDLARVVGGVSRQFSALWRAADRAGSGGLSGFADDMERIAEAMESERFQRTLAALFEGSGRASSFIGGGIGDFGRAIDNMRFELSDFVATAGQIVGRLVSDIADALLQPAFKRGLTDFITGLRDGFRDFGSFLPDVSDGVGLLMTAAGELGRQLGPVLGETLSGLSTIFEPLITTITDEVLPLLGPALVQAIQDLTPALTDLASALSPVLVMLGEIAVDALPLVTDIISGVTKFVSDISIPTLSLGISGLLDISWIWDDAKLDEVLKPFRDGEFGDVFQGIFKWADDFDAAFEAINTEMKRFLNVELPAVVAEAWNFLVQTGANVVAGIVAGIQQGMLSLTTSVLSGLVGFVEGVRGFFGIQSPSTLMRDQIGVWLIPGIVEGLTQMLPTLIGWFGRLPATILSIVSGAGRWLVSTGASILTGLMAGITQAAAAVWAFFTSLPGRIQSFLGSAGSWLLSAGRSVINGLGTGIVERFSNVYAYVAGIPGRVIALFGNAGSWLLSAGRNVMLGFVNGITSMVSRVVTAASAAANSAKNAVARTLDMHSPSRVMEALGVNTVLGYVNGITKTASKARAAATSMVSMPAVTAAATAIGTSAAPAARALAAGGVTVQVYPLPGMDEDQLVTKAVRKIEELLG